MENGGLAGKFGGLTLTDAKDSSLFQVMKAVEAAEATIHQQVEENNRLREELQRRVQELEKLKSDQTYFSGESRDAHRQLFNRDLHTASNNDPSGFQNSDNAGISQRSSPITGRFSPGRYPRDGEYDPQINLPSQGLMPVAESSNSSNLLKQIREHEEEIIQLRKRLTEYSVKEAQIRNEKYILEKRIAHMRMAFDQQQQDLVDAASKALSYRQDVIEENVRLTYALQDAQQERTTFVSTLLPLLADYSLQPQISDAQSIVSNIKVLFKHLQEKLIITEAKLKEYQYQLTPWQSDGNNPNFPPQSPEHSSGAAPTSSQIGLEIVPRPTYSPANMANSDGQITPDWESRGQNDRHASSNGAVVQNAELDNIGGYSPLASSSQNRQVKFKDPVSSSEAYGVAAGGNQNNEREHGGTWSTGNSPYSNTYEDPVSSYSPYLQTVPEEPSSSFSEAADDDPLPAIEGLQISGEAYPGQELQACGYSINGTTTCNFEWVRHLEDGSVQYIEGAKQPVYLVTADDVESYLAIEVQPLDDRKRKGELVRVFANDHQKITCDPVMRSHIEQTLRNGHASYRVFKPTHFLDMWDPVTLTIKREGYSIKGNGSSDVAVSEKFSPETTVTIAYGQDFEFSINGQRGSTQILLKAENDLPDIISVRDTIVLTLRLFIMKAVQSAKGGKKKRVRLFSK